MTQPDNIQLPLSYQIRPGRGGDIAGIQAAARASWHAAYGEIFSADSIDAFLASAYSRISLRAALANRRSTFLVALHDGRVLGYSQFGDRGAGPEMFRLYVDPRWWGQGIGRRLLSHAEMQFGALGVKRYFLTLHRRNDRAKQFYTSHGFVHHEPRDRDDELFMIKVLGAP